MIIDKIIKIGIIKRMSAEQPQQGNNQQQEQQQQQQQQQQKSEDPNALTQQDKKVYAEIMGHISRMDRKLKNVKQKVPVSGDNNAQQLKRTSVNNIAQKLIQSKQNSDIITKQDLVSDVQQTFQQVVVNVYTENQQMKNKINSLVAIIKQQNKKINQHKERQNKLKQQNEKLREQLMKYKDGHLMAELHTTSNKKGVQNASNVNQNVKAKNKTSTGQNEDYDFWSMPNNQSGAKKRKDFVADSGLWINDKDIDKSVFITDQRNKK